MINFNHSFRPNLLDEFVVSFASVHINYNAVTGTSSPAGSVYKPSLLDGQNDLCGQRHQLSGQGPPGPERVRRPALQRNGEYSL